MYFSLSCFAVDFVVVVDVCAALIVNFARAYQEKWAVHLQLSYMQCCSNS